jgi:enoyl-CoA hydratase/carnithine racemase
MLRLSAPAAVRATKDIVHRVPSMPVRSAFEEMKELSISFFASEEGQEGMRAFQERRRPSWAP